MYFSSKRENAVEILTDIWSMSIGWLGEKWNGRMILNRVFPNIQCQDSGGNYKKNCHTQDQKGMLWISLAPKLST